MQYIEVSSGVWQCRQKLFNFKKYFVAESGLTISRAILSPGEFFNLILYIYKKATLQSQHSDVFFNDNSLLPQKTEYIRTSKKKKDARGKNNG